MTTKRNGWPRGALKLIMGNATNTQELQPYVFEDDGEATAPPDLSLQEWARRCQLAHADVEIEKAGLAEARNQVVQCECRLAKAELLLERQQDEFTKAAAKLPGVPCLR